MSATKVRADYQALAQIAAEFGRQAECAARMLLQLRLQKSILQNGRWVGKGADKFYAEMDSSVLPAVQRLVKALTAASVTTLQISRVMKEAEGTAARLFQESGSDGAGIQIFQTPAPAGPVPVPYPNVDWAGLAQIVDPAGVSREYSNGAESFLSNAGQYVSTLESFVNESLLKGEIEPALNAIKAVLSMMKDVLDDPDLTLQHALESIHTMLSVVPNTLAIVTDAIRQGPLAAVAGAQAQDTIRKSPFDNGLKETLEARTEATARLMQEIARALQGTLEARTDAHARLTQEIARAIHGTLESKADSVRLIVEAKQEAAGRTIEEVRLVQRVLEREAEILQLILDAKNQSIESILTMLTQMGATQRKLADAMKE